jgi:hypothetical protein
MAEKGKDLGVNPESIDILKIATSDSSIPKIYANGFAVGLTNADVAIVLQLSGQPVAILNISFTLAKTLAQKVGGVVSALEEAINQNLVTTDEMSKALKKRVVSKPSSDVKH